MAAPVLGYTSHTLKELPGSGDITNALRTAVARPGTPYQATVVHLPEGSVTVSGIVRPANYVYIVAEANTTVTWRGSDSYMLRFNEGVTGGVSGGTWNGAGRSSTTVIGMAGAIVTLADLTAKGAAKYGVGAYKKSTLTLSNVNTSDNGVNGVHVEGSTLVASGLRSTYNRRNGVQLSGGSVGSISASVLDRNGRAVRGSTTGKIGHGLGVAASNATVVGTSMSGNKVCGASLSHSARVTISGGSHLDNNGRHGLGTDAGARARISDSTVSKNGYNGVLASGSGTHVALEHVTIDAAKQRGLSVPSRGAATISDTLITNGGKYSVSVSGKGLLTMLGGNTVSGSRSHGILVSSRGTLRITGDGNLVTRNRGDGLRLTGSGTSGRFSAPSSFVNNRGSGVAVISKARLRMVRNCVLTGNKKAIETRSKGRVTYP